MLTENLSPPEIPLRWVYRLLALFLFILPYALLGLAGSLETKTVFFFLCMGYAFICYWLIFIDAPKIFRDRYIFQEIVSPLFLTTSKILCLGIILRIFLLGFPPCDDIYRYIWEGKVLNSGLSPYHLAPNSDSLQSLRDATWPMINHPNIPALYPPLTEGLFALFYKINPSIIGFKIFFLLFDLIAFGMFRLILHTFKKKLPLHTTRLEAIYFLNPLLILEISGRGHFDSIPIFFNLVFLWGMIRLQPWAPMYLILGALSKINSLALIPMFFLQYSWKKALIGSGIILAITSYLIYQVGSLKTLTQFSTQFHYNEIVPFFFASLFPNLPQIWQSMLLLFIMGACLIFLFIHSRKKNHIEQALGFMSLLLLFSPTLHPWYLLWILPFAVIHLSRPWLLYSGTILISYGIYIPMQKTGEWIENPWLRIPQLLPPLALWLILISRPRKTLSE